MLTLELSSYLQEIPDEAYTFLTQTLIDCPLLSQDGCKLIVIYWVRNYVKAILHINIPFLFVTSLTWEIMI